MFIIYTKDSCIFCVKAKELLTENKYAFEEKNVLDENFRAELLLRLPEAHTVPQIFKDNNYIGGYTDLVEYFNQTI